MTDTSPPPTKKTKILVSLEPDVLAKLRETVGTGFQSAFINETLRWRFWPWEAEKPEGEF